MGKMWRWADPSTRLGVRVMAKVRARARGGLKCRCSGLTKLCDVCGFCAGPARASIRLREPEGVRRGEVAQWLASAAGQADAEGATRLAYLAENGLGE